MVGAVVVVPVFGTSGGWCSGSASVCASGEWCSGSASGEWCSGSASVWCKWIVLQTLAGYADSA